MFSFFTLYLIDNNYLNRFPKSGSIPFVIFPVSFSATLSAFSSALLIATITRSSMASLSLMMSFEMSIPRIFLFPLAFTLTNPFSASASIMVSPSFFLSQLLALAFETSNYQTYLLFYKFIKNC